MTATRSDAQALRTGGPDTWCDREKPKAAEQTLSHSAARSGLTFWRGRAADSRPDGECRPVAMSGLAIRDPQFPERA
jgi:hypothetical protein